MTLRVCLRLLVLAAILLAPVGRIGIAQAMAASATAGSPMAGHCAEMPAPPAHDQKGHQQKAPERTGEGMAVDCMTACAAMVAVPATFFAPPAAMLAPLSAPFQPGLAGIRPEAEPPPPRFS